jgi:hypothetical protein
LQISEGGFQIGLSVQSSFNPLDANLQSDINNLNSVDC